MMHERDAGRRNVALAWWRSEGEGHPEQRQAERADGKAEQEHDTPPLLLLF